MKAKDNLVLALNKAVEINGSGNDMDGNSVSPSSDAIAAYQACVQRMTGTKNQLMPGTLRLSLGCIPQIVTTTKTSSVQVISEITTNTLVPQPAGAGRVQSQAQVNGCYVAYVNQPYTTTAGKQYDFIFAGVASDVILAESKYFVSPVHGTLPGLPYSIPSIVLCEAEQQFKDLDEHGRPMTRIIHASACAQPMCNIDPRPHPGAFTITFPDGMISETKALIDLFNNPSIAENPCDLVQTPVAGDFPEQPLFNTKLPQIASDIPVIANSAHPWVAQAESVALYDWVRRGGARVNIQALETMLKRSFQAPTNSTGCIQAYEFDSAGNVTVNVLPCSQVTSARVSQNQWVATSGGAVVQGSGKNQKWFDVVIKDQCYHPGRMTGGQLIQASAGGFQLIGGQSQLHGGEPLANQWTASNPDYQSTIVDLLNGEKVFAQQISPPPRSVFPTPLGPPKERPTYSKMGQAADITIRQHTPLP